jgi:tetraacyldisaccharide 4'-kinase
MSGRSDPLLDSLYGQVMRVRRVWSESHPDRRRRLARPVISVGNLSVGGTGKTPVVAAIAKWLVAQGERPSILSRGYGRAESPEGVVVVSDHAGVLAGIDRSGDEPIMLARQVPGAAVCVSPDRYLSGSVAERTLGCTVHILDDGFQHVQLWRDLDVLVTSVGEIPNGRVIPAGRLREPMDMASRAHVLVVSDATAGAASAEAWALGVSLSCGALRSLGGPLRVPESIIAVAGIAYPERFFELLRDAGWNVRETISFPDHHRYTRADIDRIGQQAKQADATIVLTTDKDAVRFEAIGDLPFDLRPVPLTLQFDPPDALFESVRSVIA